jgi:hypothetical protein
MNNTNQDVNKCNEHMFAHLSDDATDSIQMWMADCCGVSTDPLSSRSATSALEMYESYKNWRLCDDEDVMSERSFHKQMAEHGHVPKATDSDFLYIGIDLIHPFF